MAIIVQTINCLFKTDNTNSYIQLLNLISIVLSIFAYCEIFAKIMLMLPDLLLNPVAKTVRYSWLLCFLFSQLFNS